MLSNAERAILLQYLIVNGAHSWDFFETSLLKQTCFQSEISSKQNKQAQGPFAVVPLTWGKDFIQKSINFDSS